MMGGIENTLIESRVMISIPVPAIKSKRVRSRIVFKWASIPSPGNEQDIVWETGEAIQLEDGSGNIKMEN